MSSLYIDAIAQLQNIFAYFHWIACSHNMTSLKSNNSLCSPAKYHISNLVNQELRIYILHKLNSEQDNQQAKIFIKISIYYVLLNADCSIAWITPSRVHRFASTTQNTKVGKLPNTNSEKSLKRSLYLGNPWASYLSIV